MLALFKKKKKSFLFMEKDQNRKEFLFIENDQDLNE